MAASPGEIRRSCLSDFRTSADEDASRSLDLPSANNNTLYQRLQMPPPEMNSGQTSAPTSPNTGRMPPPPEMNSGQTSSSNLLSLRRRVQLCLVLLALECYVSLEEIFMVSALRRVAVPTALVSLPGVLSTANSLFIVPLLGWASDRLLPFPCCCRRPLRGWGQKRPYALLSLVGMVAGASLLVAVQAQALYDSLHYVTNNETDVTSTAASADVQSDGLFSVVDGGGNVTNSKTDVTSTASSADVQFDGLFSTHGQRSSGGGGGGGGGGDTSGMTVVGWLAVLGFALSDLFYDSCMATFRSYTMAVTPASQHDAMMVLGTLLGAVGGCLTSLLGFVDLAAVFVLGSDVRVDKGVFQCLAQSTVVLVLVLVLGPVSLLTGSESTTGRVTPASSTGSGSADRITAALSTGSKSADRAVTSALLTGSASADRVTSASLTGSASVGGVTPALNWESMTVAYQNLAHQETRTTGDRLGDTTDALEKVIIRRTVKSYGDPGRSNDVLVWETTPLIRPTSISSAGSKKQKTKKLVFLCVMSFLGFCTNYAYFIFVSNYVGEVIYNGDPCGPPDSDGYSRYVDGVHMSALGMTTFYCLLVAFNLLHGHILEKVGMKAEYVVSSVGCLVTMVALTLIADVYVFFATQVAFVAYRSAVYTVPFILVNKYSQQDLGPARSGEEAPSGSGLDMALVTSSMTFGYLLVGSAMGPLMALTGYPATPLVFASASCVLGILATVFVKFE